MPEEYEGEGKKPAWVEAGDLFEEGVLPSQVIEELRDAIEEQCQSEDAKRHQAAADKQTRIIDTALAEGRLPTAAEALQEQFRLFREKFGRDPKPDEPIFFDPDQDQPTM